MSFLDPQNPGIGGIDELTDAETTLIQSLAALGDPNADRILFWDDSAGSFKYLQVGTNLTITNTTLDATGGASGVDTANSPNAGEFARFTDADTIEGRTAAEVKSDLDLEIGTDLQAWSANLDEYSAVNPTAAGLALLDDANAAAQLVTLGFAATITELNYVDGVTSAIQTQLDGKELLTNKAINFSVLNDTLYPTTSAVATYVAAQTVGLLDYRGSYDASTNLYPATGGSGLLGAILKGDFYIVSVAGTLGGTPVTAGDLIIAIVDTPGQTASNWDLIESDLGYTPANDALSNLSSVAINAALVLGTSDAFALGSGTKMWSDLFLANGAVINFNNGAATITHSQPAGSIITIGGSGATTLALGTNTLTLTGSIAATGARVTKGWFTDIESTNMPTVGGTAILSSLTAPQFTTIELGHATDTTLSRGAAGFIAIEGNRVPSPASQAAGDMLYRDTTEWARLAKGTAGQILTMNAGATAPSWAASSSTASYTAQENITIGQPVGIVNLLDNYVARANRFGVTVAHGISSPLRMGNNHIACPIGANKFVMLQETTAGSGTLIAQVGSWDTATNAMTLGTAVTVATAYTPSSTRLDNTAICKLDTDKFIVFYLLDASTTIIKYRIATVSGTTISFGTEATADTAGSTVATSLCFGADFLSTDKGVFFYKAATTTNSKAIVFTASGTVATFGTPIALGTNTQINDVSYVKKIGTDKFVIVCQNASNSIYGQVGTCTGTTTITLGSELQVTTAASIGQLNAIQIVSPATDVFVVRFESAVASAGLVACTVATRTITAGTAITKAGSTNFGAVGGAYTTDASTIWVTGNTIGGQIWKATLSGTTLTDANFVAQIITNSAMAAAITVYTDSGVAVVCDESDATNNYFWAYGMSNNYIGIAQATVNAGQAVTVLLNGVDTNQSGLSAGALYTISAGTLTFVSSNGAISTLANIDTVLALSSTTIQVY